jgi:hypothetical protein
MFNNNMNNIDPMFNGNMNILHMNFNINMHHNINNNMNNHMNNNMNFNMNNNNNFNNNFFNNINNIFNNMNFNMMNNLINENFKDWEKGIKYFFKDILSLNNNNFIISSTKHIKNNNGYINNYYYISLFSFNSQEEITKIEINRNGSYDSFDMNNIYSMNVEKINDTHIIKVKLNDIKMFILFKNGQFEGI